MPLSPAHRHVILLSFTFVAGLWVGHGLLDERAGSTSEAIVTVGSGQGRTSDVGGEATGRASLPAPTAPRPAAGDAAATPSIADARAPQATSMAEPVAPVDSRWSEAYSFEQDGVAPELVTLEPSPQSTVNTVSRSLEEIGMPPEEVQAGVENFMAMLQDHREPPEAYPSVPADR
jgi:hypothetical protein